MGNKRVVLFYWGLAEIFCKICALVCKELTKRSCDVIMIDTAVLDKAKMDEIVSAFSKPLDFVVGIPGGPEFLQNKRGVSIYDELNIPYLSWQFDAPFQDFSIRTFQETIYNRVLLCVDRSHLDFLKMYYDPGHVTMAVFLPGSYWQLMTDGEPGQECQKREIDVAFAGNVLRDPIISGRFIPQWHQMNLPEIIKRILDDVLEVALLEENYVLAECLQVVLKNRGLDLALAHMRKLLSLIFLIDRYIRSWRRYKLISEFVQQELPIHIYGDQWDLPPFNRLLESKYVHLRDIKGIQLQRELQNSKLVLNDNSGLPDSAHDRVFNTMYHGGVNFSCHSKYLDEKFVDKKDTLFYSWKNLARLRDIVEDALSNPGELQKIANAGRANVLMNHSWEKRVNKILETVDLFKSLR